MVILKFRNSIILLCALCFVLASLGLVKYFKEGKNTRQDVKFFNIQDIDEISEIRISSGQAQESVLRKKEGAWVVEGKIDYPCDPDFLAQAFDVFLESKQGEIAAKNVENHKIFNVDESGVSVKAFSSGGDVLVDVILGKEGPGSAFSYARRAGSDEVYMVQGNIVRAFSHLDFRDKSLWKFDKEKAVLIDINYEKTKISLFKSEGKWKILTKEASQEKVESFLLELLAVVAVKIDDSITKEEVGVSDYEKASIKIKIGFEDGSVDYLVVGKSPEQEKIYRYAATRGNDVVFLVEDGLISDIIKKQENYFYEN